MRKLNSVKDLIAYREHLSSKGILAPGKKRIKVCCGTACRANHSLALVENLKQVSQNSQTDTEVITTGCQGLCQMGPVMITEPHGYFYHKVGPERAGDIISRTVKGDKPLWDLLYRRSLGSKPALTIRGDSAEAFQEPEYVVI